MCVGRGAVRFLALPHVPASYAPFNCDPALRVKYMYVTMGNLRTRQPACEDARQKVDPRGGGWEFGSERGSDFGIVGLTRIDVFRQ